MERDYWLKKWEQNDIGFHRSEVNPLLAEHLAALRLPRGARVFLPLCGKTRDIAWLLSRGYRVAGAELSELAVEQLFAELGASAEVSPIGPIGGMRRYSGEGIDIFVGDLFELSAEILGPVDAVYDRAALVALPDATRGRYTEHLRAMTGRAPQLLIVYEYDQSRMPGPPFSVPDSEVKAHYESAYEVARLSRADVPGGLKGVCPAVESVYLLSKKKD